MPARNRLAAIAAITLITTSSAMLLTACDPSGSPESASTPASSGKSSASPGKSSAAPSSDGGASMNGTSAANRLTISDGSNTVLMNGTSVDFGTAVRDLAWSPDGSRAAFIDGEGDLVVSAADGTGRKIVAKNPGGRTWSHPTWQVYGKDDRGDHSGEQNLIFTAKQGGTLELDVVDATATGATPKPLPLANSEDTTAQPPLTGNQWPNSGGPQGFTAYANTDGQVYLRDDYVRLGGGATAKGSEPALAPDGRTVVFVRSVDGHDHLFEKTGYDHSEKDLTPDATTDYTEPAISHDGRTIAVRTPDGIYTLPIDGSAAPTRVSTRAGLPAYR
ncbi:hypothetical protein [Streptomyces sp. NPDC005262]|uniref:TolB family protein n=1 Tax=Streptomyces sp. NPDC005262 TaxID=3364710 RepID=UPI0036C3C339